MYTFTLLGVLPNPSVTSRYDMMLSCWNDDPLKRPSFRKLVERTELLLSENTKNVSSEDRAVILTVICLLHMIIIFASYPNLNAPQVYLRLSNATNAGEQQRAPSRRLSSVCSTTAPTQPLLQSTADVFLDYV